MTPRSVTIELQNLFRPMIEQCIAAGTRLATYPAMHLQDLARHFEFARSSALECAAVQQVMIASGGLDGESSCAMNLKPKRIISMLTRLAKQTDGAAESLTGCDANIEYEHN